MSTDALELDVDTYMRLSIGSREALDAWMRTHGIDPMNTDRLRFGEGITDAHQVVAWRIPIEYLWTTFATPTPPPRAAIAEWRSLVVAAL